MSINTIKCIFYQKLNGSLHCGLLWFAYAEENVDMNVVVWGRDNLDGAETEVKNGKNRGQRDITEGKEGTFFACCQPCFK